METFPYSKELPLHHHGEPLPLGAIAASGMAETAAAPQEDELLQRCGFAKLYGDDLEYFVRKYEITLGRRSNSTSLDVVLGNSATLDLELGSWGSSFGGKGARSRSCHWLHAP